MNCGEWVFKRALSNPEEPFLKDKGFSLSNAAFNMRVNRVASLLLAAGVSRGDRVACLLENCSAFLELFFACAKIGVIMVPLNYRLAGPELVVMLNDSEPTMLVYSRGFTAKVSAIE